MMMVTGPSPGGVLFTGLSSVNCVQYIMYIYIYCHNFIKNKIKLSKSYIFLVTNFYL